MLPFSQDEFIAVFASYNEAIWPLQVLAFILGVTCLVLFIGRVRWANQAILIILALLWLYTGGVYHLVFFSKINAAAYGFGVLFLAMGVLLMTVAIAPGSVRFSPWSGARGTFAWALLIYALVLYPLIGLLAGAGWPGSPLFGVTPCPVTLFTLGFLLSLKEGPFWLLLAVPLIWSLIGGSAAFLLGMPQDWMLLLAGPGTALLWWRGPRPK